MATILSSKKSAVGGPYVYYTVNATASDRTVEGITVKISVTSKLASSSSVLGTGSTYGLVGYIKLKGTEYAITLKGTSESWSGTTAHTASITKTITGLNVTDTSLTGITFRVTRTGDKNDGSIAHAGELGATSCSNITFEQAKAQSVFNSVTSGSTNGTFSIDATQYGLYDVLEVLNGTEPIATFNDVKSGVAYAFSSEQQETLNSLFGASDTKINLTARLTTYIDNTKETNLGSTDKTMELSLPSYTPEITFDSYSTNDELSDFKINSNDVIKDLSTVNIVLKMSNNYNNTYSKAICNNTNGTIDGRTITFNNLVQSNKYEISITDSRNKIVTKTINGNSYDAEIKTVQYYLGTVKASVVRPSSVGSEAIITVEVNSYNGDNLKNLLADDFIFTYQETGGISGNVQMKDFELENGKYIFTIDGLTYTNEVKWSITGTDKIGKTLSGNSGTLSVGLPVWDAFRENNINFFNVNGAIRATTFQNMNTCNSNSSEGSRWQRLCTIKKTEHIQGSFARFRINFGYGNNGNATQNAFIDLTLQQSYTGSNEGRYGGNYVLYPLLTNFNLNRVKIIVLSIDVNTYEIWFYTTVTYCKPTYSYDADNKTTIVHDGITFQTEEPTGTKCNVSGLNVALASYPIHSVYLSFDEDDPATMFGGTWEKLPDRVLVGAGNKYASRDEGGSADAIVVDHTHTIDSSGAHYHTTTSLKSTGSTSGSMAESYAQYGSTRNIRIPYSGTNGAHTHTVNNTGQDGTEANMPPYVAIYMWERTA